MARTSAIPAIVDDSIHRGQASRGIAPQRRPLGRGSAAGSSFHVRQARRRRARRAWGSAPSVGSCRGCGRARSRPAAKALISSRRASSARSQPIRARKAIRSSGRHIQVYEPPGAGCKRSSRIFSSNRRNYRMILAMAPEHAHHQQLLRTERAIALPLAGLRHTRHHGHQLQTALANCFSIIWTDGHRRGAHCLRIFSPCPPPTMEAGRCSAWCRRSGDRFPDRCREPRRSFPRRTGCCRPG